MLSPACAVNGLSFVADDRIQILEPKEGAEVSLPLEVVWTAEDFEGDFAVFFDRSPIRPNQSLLAVVPDDDPCRADPGCPDPQWLADRDVYVTETTSLSVKVLPDRRDNNRAKDRHYITIVLLDDDGHRSGEAAFTKEFVVERES